MTTDWPTLSVIMPVRDEADHLEAAVGAILDQDYPGAMEVVLSVAPSTDVTAEVANRLASDDRRILVVDNPQGSTPAGLNRAIDSASGAVIARVDAHSELTPGYLRTAVQVLREQQASNVGGIQRAVGSTPMQRAIAIAMSSRFGTGDARFHFGGEAGPIDSVYLGVFHGPTLRSLGGFDESLIRNQDYELNVRIRERGGLVWFDPRLEVIYRPRRTLQALGSQYWQYGRWKRATLRKHPTSLRWRQLVPPAALLANAAGLLGALLSPWTLLVPGVYLTAVAGVSIAASSGDVGLLVRLPAAFATMHHAWAAGFLVGAPRP